MRKIVFSVVLIICTLQLSAKKKEYKATWESLAAYNETPEWFADAKMGIYFTWGVHTVPAFGSEWYPYFLYRKDGNKDAKHHWETYGADFEYHDFVPMFKAEHFDAEDWAKLFKATGAKFAGPCAQHQDGFALWDSKVNPWNSADRGPKKDLTGELEKAIKAENLKLITTFHHARNGQRYANDPEHWGGYNSHFTYDPNHATSSTDPDTAKLYGNISEEAFNQYWYDQLEEVIDQYSPDVIWFDSWVNLIPKEYRQQFAAYYLNEAKKKKQEVVIGYKQNDFPKSLGVLDIEQGGKKDLSESIILGSLAIRTGKGFEYDQKAMKVIGNEEANEMIEIPSRKGFRLEDLEV